MKHVVKRNVGAHLKKGHCAKWRLNWLHLRVLGQQHVLDTRLAVVQWTVPRHVVAATKRVFWGTKITVCILFFFLNPKYVLSVPSLFVQKANRARKIS